MPQDWTAPTKPGEHAVLQGARTEDVLDLRRKGLQVRDTLLVIGPKGKVTLTALVRVPSDGTVAANLLKHGQGALNLDACRVRTQDDTGRTRNTALGVMNDDAWKPRHMESESHPCGRWPTNILLVHDTGCRDAGTKRVISTSIPGRAVAIRRTGVHSPAGGHQTIGRPQPVFGYSDPDGTEIVKSWDCAEGCLVAGLDRQTGLLHSNSGTAFKRNPDAARNAFGKFNGIDAQGFYGDTGGASRFYPQFDGNEAATLWLELLVGRS